MIVRGTGDRIATGVLRLHRAFVGLSGDDGEALAREQLSEARTATSAGTPPLVDVSDDARTAVRLIEGALARGQPKQDVLVVGPGATWFRPPGEATQQLAHRLVLRRLLLRLVEQHQAGPGEGLSLDALREAGWPDEKALPAAALNRVHVALTELRRRGLRACLVRRESRYLIHPALRIEMSEAPGTMQKGSI
jgi:hypothetical protein